MRIILVFFMLCFSVVSIYAQEYKTLVGIIIDEEINVLSNVSIYSADTTFLGSSNDTGFFSISVPMSTSELLIAAMGMEWVRVKIDNNCTVLEIVMMIRVIYDFVPLRVINRKRRARFRKLPMIHKEAFRMGVFRSESPSVNYVFEPF
jgi:hypothetical protein